MPLSEPFWLRKAKLSIRFDFQTFQSNVTMIQTAPILELARILILDLKARTNPARVTTHKLVFLFVIMLFFLLETAQHRF